MLTQARAMPWAADGPRRPAFVDKLLDHRPAPGRRPAHAANHLVEVVDQRASVAQVQSRRTRPADHRLPRPQAPSDRRSSSPTTCSPSPPAPPSPRRSPPPGHQPDPATPTCCRWCSELADSESQRPSSPSTTPLRPTLQRISLAVRDAADGARHLPRPRPRSTTSLVRTPSSPAANGHPPGQHHNRLARRRTNRPGQRLPALLLPPPPHPPKPMGRRDGSRRHPRSHPATPPRPTPKTPAAPEVQTQTGMSRESGLTARAHCTPTWPASPLPGGNTVVNLGAVGTAEPGWRGHRGGVSPRRAAYLVA